MIDLPLPSLGPDMQSGKLLEWRVAPGDTVQRGTVIAVVDTEKAAIDVESWHEGTMVALLAQPGEELAVGTVIARLAAPGETVTAASGEAVAAAAATAAAGNVEVARPGPVAAVVAGRERASPAARARARVLGVELAQLSSHRPDGVITLEDVEAAARAASGAAIPAAGGAPDATPPDRHAGVRNAIAAAMTRSKREIPHYYLWDDIDVSHAMQWLEATNAGRPATERLFPVAMLLSAVARAASEFPDMNGHYDGGTLRSSAAVHLGVAVALRGGGLIAPAIRDAGSLRPDALMRQLSDLVARARRGGLRSSEVSGQTLTVTHLGEGGSRGLLGVIHPPQVALVGIGRIDERPFAVAGSVVARAGVTVSLAADHRVSDGRRGAQFLARIGALLQQPESL